MRYFDHSWDASRFGIAAPTRGARARITIAILAAVAGLIMTGCPENPYHGGAEGGELTLGVSAQGWGGLSGSRFAEVDSDSSALEWSNDVAFADGQGTSIAWDASHGGNYFLQSGAGDGSVEREGVEFSFNLDGYREPGRYMDSVDRLTFVWQGEIDPATGARSALSIRGQPDGACEVVVDEGAYSGSIECTGLEATVDGVEWAGSPFTLTATWIAEGAGTQGFGSSREV